MALPGENEHVAYLQYVERWSLGEESGPKLDKAEWRKTRKKKEEQKNKNEKDSPLTLNFENSDHR